jgi:galactokinase/mevalonate kinase-like predicted kinase
LFHDVLRLEQALTTGGGWQDQVGGCVGGCKITATLPGLVPDPVMEALPSTVLDPQTNGGCTLLYYTGLTRLAKNILQEIVGACLDREPAIMTALAQEHEVAQAIAGALRQNDMAGLGAGLDAAWELQKRLCGVVTNPEIESLLRRVRPHVHGMRISGAGSCCWSASHRRMPARCARASSRSRSTRARVFSNSASITPGWKSPPAEPAAATLVGGVLDRYSLDLLNS